ncbi:MAG: peptide chain release factor N(5)-glutamine methyltransferase [Mesorhizobium sp.]|nr:peptide chain release factor N(5)-glutamine methyltransferase [Mesorhizobium sp.]MBL8578684.1 peptide chain release factor N(5)-glutamine methyltransferase [Mesorhizobium sp.]
MPQETKSLSSVERGIRTRLRDAGIATPELDARLIVEHLTGFSLRDFIISGDTAIAGDVVERLEFATSRRIAGEPVHRIIGFREFYGLKLFLSSETLEPRPDTETLVDAVLPRLRQIVARQGVCRILDLGTGTGAIALALLAEVPQAHATAVDISSDALTTATRNALENGLSDRFQLVQSDWFEKISGAFHAIVSNPPYISTEELVTLQDEVRKHDPAKALDGGPDGLDAYRKIAEASLGYLEDGGFVGVEIGHRQKADVIRLFEDRSYRLLEARQDFGGHDRALVFAGK